MTASTVPGRATWTVGWRGRPVRFERRAVVVAAVALAGLAVLALFSICLLYTSDAADDSTEV